MNRDMNSSFCNQLFWRFIHTTGFEGSNERLINVQNHFYSCNKATALFRNYPFFPLPGLQDQFFLILMFRIREIYSMVEWLIFHSLSSQLSKIRALRIFYEFCLPFERSSQRSSCSSSVSVKAYLFISNSKDYL